MHVIIVNCSEVQSIKMLCNCLLTVVTTRQSKASTREAWWFGTHETLALGWVKQATGEVLLDTHIPAQS